MVIDKWKKVVLKGYILYDSIYVTFWKRQKYRGGKRIGISSYQIFLGWEGWMDEAHGIFRTVKLLGTL